MSEFTPKDVSRFGLPTKGFLCNEYSNSEYQLEFLQIQFRNLRTGTIFFESPKKPPTQGHISQSNVFYYDLGIDFLRLGTVGVTVTFHLGGKEIQKMRLVENHFFQDHHLKTFDFVYGSVQHNTENRWEMIYEFPSFNDEQENMIIGQPFKFGADTFVFADDELIIHNKTMFSFSSENSKL